MKAFFRTPDGTWLNVAALAYTLLGYAVGIALMIADPWYANLAGVVLAACIDLQRVLRP